MILSAVVIAITAFFHMLQFTTVWDDAFITFRVTQNWVLSGMPVYNIGQMEWVPTIFLWTAILAGCHKLTTLPVPLISQGLGALVGLMTLFIVFQIGAKNSSKITVLIAIGLCAFSSLWAAWPLSGVETALFTLLITASVLFIINYLEDEKRSVLVLSAILMGMAFLTRPEALAIFLICLVYIMVIKKAYKAAGVYLFIFAMIALIGIGYLFFNFDNIIPSSFFVKVHGLQNITAGKAYLKNFIKIYNLIWISPLLILPWIKKSVRQHASESKKHQLLQAEIESNQWLQYYRRN